MWRNLPVDKELVLRDTKFTLGDAVPCFKLAQDQKRSSPWLYLCKDPGGRKMDTRVILSIC
jgi:hypothetical protein